MLLPISYVYSRNSRSSRVDRYTAGNIIRDLILESGDVYSKFAPCDVILQEIVSNREIEAQYVIA